MSRRCAPRAGERYQLIPSPRIARGSQSGYLRIVPHAKDPHCFAHSRERTHQFSASPVRSAFRQAAPRRRSTTLRSRQIWRDRSENSGCPKSRTSPLRGSRRRTLTALAFSRNARPGLRPGLAPDSALRASRGSNLHYVSVLADLASRLRCQSGMMASAASTSSLRSSRGVNGSQVRRSR